MTGSLGTVTINMFSERCRAARMSQEPYNFLVVVLFVHRPATAAHQGSIWPGPGPGPHCSIVQNPQLIPTQFHFQENMSQPEILSSIISGILLPSTPTDIV